MNPTDPNPGFQPPQQPPRFEWDYWEEDALERGLDHQLATLGRAVLREAIQHDWPSLLHQVCSGDTLDALLFKAPELARRLYELLLETDGLRVGFAENDGAKMEMIELRDF